MNKILFFIIIIISICLGLFALKYNILLKEKNYLILNNSKLEKGLVNKVNISKTQIVVQTKYKDKIVTVIKYLPPEGSATIATTDLGETLVDIKNKGFTLTPSASFLMNKDFYAGLSLRLFFWNRYGCGIGFSSILKPYGFLDRRIDDFVPFMQNTSVGIFYDGSIGLQLSVYF